MVHFEALRGRLGTTAAEDRVSPLRVFRMGWYYMTPIVVLFYVLFTGGTASLAAFYAIGSFVILMAVQYAAQGQVKNFFLTLFNGLVDGADKRSEEHTSELQSLMRISYAVFCLTKKKNY